MIRLAIVVEGETEEDFVKDVLSGHLQDRGVYSYPILPGRRGGDIRVERLAPEMAKLTRNFDYVTSLVDFYGFSDKGSDSPCTLEQRINRAVSEQIHQSWDESRVFAYVQRHEFESLLFSDVSRFGAVLDDLPSGALTELREVRRRFPKPEDINDSSATAPSKRISQLIPHYNKRVHGPELAMEIGLPTIRNECARFNQWLSRLESLGG